MNKRRKQKVTYTKKFRASPIFEAPETLYTGKIDVSLKPIKKATTKPQVKRTSVKPINTKVEFDLGLENNKKQKTIRNNKKNKKQFWEV